MNSLLRQLIYYASLAPSSHNTQPWIFSIEGNSIHIDIDPARKLLYSDPTGRLAHMALGTAAENIAIAADHYGHGASFYAGGHGVSLRIDKREGVLRYPESFFRALENRVSYRGAYHKNTVPNDIIKILQKTRYDSSSIVLLTEMQKCSLAEIAGIGMKEKMGDRAFRRELAGWLRINRTRKKDGMPGEGHGLSLPLSILAPIILRFVDVSQKEKEKMIARVYGFPMAGVIVGAKDAPEEWVAAGRVLEHAFIACTAHHLGFSIIAAPTESNAARKQLSALLARNSVPHLVFGFGKPNDTAPHSPRRPIEDMITHAP